VFDGVVTKEHREHVTAWWAEVMGGPAVYTDRHGGYEHMLAKHRGLAITAEQRLRFVTLLSAAADSAGVPDDPEARAALMGYAEWGSRLARTQRREQSRRRTPRCHAGAGAWRRRINRDQTVVHHRLRA